MDYTMTVEIPLTNVPEDVEFVAAKVAAEIWLAGKIEDAVMVKFEVTP